MAAAASSWGHWRHLNCRSCWPYAASLLCLLPPRRQQGGRLWASQSPHVRGARPSGGQSPTARAARARRDHPPIAVLAWRPPKAGVWSKSEGCRGTPVPPPCH
eukprot:scaffold81425_cov15-Tisochrysis_lutea.AAC.1